MAPIHSWTTLERVIRTSIFTVIITVFTLLCYRDRFWAYPQENVDTLLRSFPDRQGLEVTPDPRITESVATTLTRGMTIAQLEERLGPPAFSDDAQAVYFGEAGMLLVPLRRSRVSDEPIWRDGPHSAMDLTLQLIMAIGLTPVSLFALFHFGRVLATRAVLSDAGLKVRGHPLVPLQSIKNMDASQYRKKGRIDFEYTLDGKQGRLRLDDYVHREFPAMVRDICTRREFENPLADSSTDRADDDADGEEPVSPGPAAESSDRSA